MKRIQESRKIFNATPETDLAGLKTTYRNLIKQWHPDKFQDDHEKAEEAAATSQSIIEAYHFLVSISPETHEQNAEAYATTTETSGIDDFIYKGQTLKIAFHDGNSFEYFGVPKNVYVKFINSPSQARFARRHIFHTYLRRNISKNAVPA